MSVGSNVRSGSVSGKPRLSAARGALIGVLLTVGSVLVTLLAGELISRLAGYRGVEQYQPDEELGWILSPGQRTVTSVGRLPVRINAEGFRDDSLITPKPAGTIRIFALGASSTYGWGVRQEETYHQVLERVLNDSARAAGSRARFEVVNAGVIGYNLWQAERLMRRIAARYQPDGFIVAYTFNDAWNRAGRLNEEERENILAGVRRKNLLRQSALFNGLVDIRARRLARLAREKGGPGAMAIAQTGDTAATPAELAAYTATLDSMASLARKAALSLVFVVPAARGQTAMNQRQQAMIDAGRASRLPVAHWGQLVESEEPDSMYLPDDAVHPSAAGHALMARRIYVTLCARAGQAPEGNPSKAYRPGCR